MLLNSDLILDEDHLLKREILEKIHADDSYKTFSLAYYETLERDFFEEGWINRIRLKYEEDRDDSIRFLSELSFEAEEYEEAAISRKKMMDTLLNLGILLKVDSLKTQQMLDAYLVSP